MSALPAKLKQHWIGRALMMEDLNEKLDVQCAEALAFFRQKGLACVILKGQGIAKLYPHPNHRACGDIDIWVNMTRNQAWRFSKENTGKVEGANYHHIHYPLFDDTEVELHFCPSYLSNPVRNTRLHKFVREFSPDNNSDYPSLVFNRVYILLHCYRHLCGHGVGMRQLMDYYYVLLQGFTEEERIDSLNWIKFLGMRRFAGAVMWFCCEVFGMDEKYCLCEADEKEGQFLLSEVMHTGNMGHFDSRVKDGAYSTAFKRYISNLKRSAHLCSHYPEDCLWAPFFNLWLYFFRLFKKYTF